LRMSIEIFCEDGLSSTEILEKKNSAISARQGHGLKFSAILAGIRWGNLLEKMVRGSVYALYSRSIIGREFSSAPANRHRFGSWGQGLVLVVDWVSFIPPARRGHDRNLTADFAAGPQGRIWTLHHPGFMAGGNHCSSRAGPPSYGRSVSARVVLLGAGERICRVIFQGAGGEIGAQPPFSSEACHPRPRRRAISRVASQPAWVGRYIGCDRRPRGHHTIVGHRGKSPGGYSWDGRIPVSFRGLFDRFGRAVVYLRETLRRDPQFSALGGRRACGRTRGRCGTLGNGLFRGALAIDCWWNGLFLDSSGQGGRGRCWLIFMRVFWREKRSVSPPDAGLWGARSSLIGMWCSSSVLDSTSVALGPTRFAVAAGVLTIGVGGDAAVGSAARVQWLASSQSTVNPVSSAVGFLA